MTSTIYSNVAYIEPNVKQYFSHYYRELVTYPTKVSSTRASNSVCITSVQTPEFGRNSRKHSTHQAKI